MRARRFVPRLAVVLAIGASSLAGCRKSCDGCGSNGETLPTAAPEPTVKKTDEEWRKALTPEQYRVMREKGTERAFSGKYWDTKTPGEYRCAACGALLFTSDTKFDSGCGWPSFFKPAAGAGITETKDESYGMDRTEVTCSHCGAHLGHVFDDGPNPTGLRYCINSASIDLKPKATDEKAK